MRSTLLMLIFLTFHSVAFAQSAPGDAAPSIIPPSVFWIDGRRGWHFYEDPDPVVESPKEIKQEPPKPIIQAKPSERKPAEIIQFERLQRQVEETRNIAIINPTEANVKRYLELETAVIQRARYFSEVAQRVAWANPELDPSPDSRPMNAKALEVYDREQRTTRAETVANLGQDHVLMFFFRSDCKFCHAFGPIVESFSKRYGIKVLPVSLDGGPIPGFQEFRTDNGISKSLSIKNVPAVFLAQPFTGQITTIGFGVLSETELLERITTVTSPGAAKTNPSLSRKIAFQ